MYSGLSLYSSLMLVFCPSNRVRTASDAVPWEEEDAASEDALLWPIQPVSATANTITSKRMLNFFMSNADLRFPDVHQSDGSTVPLSESRYSKYIISQDRKLRQEAFHNLFTTYHGFRNTFASLYSSSIKASQFISQTRGYESMDDEIRILKILIISQRPVHFTPMQYRINTSFFHPDYNCRPRNLTGSCHKGSRALPPIGNCTQPQKTAALFVYVLRITISV